MPGTVREAGPRQPRAVLRQRGLLALRRRRDEHLLGLRVLRSHGPPPAVRVPRDLRAPDRDDRAARRQGPFLGAARAPRGNTPPPPAPQAPDPRPQTILTRAPLPRQTYTSPTLIP